MAPKQTKLISCGVNTASSSSSGSGGKVVTFEKIKADDKEARERYIKGNPLAGWAGLS